MRVETDVPRVRKLLTPPLVLSVFPGKDVVGDRTPLVVNSDEP